MATIRDLNWNAYKAVSDDEIEDANKDEKKMRVLMIIREVIKILKRV